MFRPLRERERESSVLLTERPEELEGNGCSETCGGCYGDDSCSDAALCQPLVMVHLPRTPQSEIRGTGVFFRSELLTLSSVR